MATISETVRTKAIRYICEGRIRPESIGGPIESWLAFSDDGVSRYRVVVGPSWDLDDCPAPTMCCHRVGAHLLSKLRRTDPVRYQNVVNRILDRAAREQDPLTHNEIEACIR